MTLNEFGEIIAFNPTERLGRLNDDIDGLTKA